MIGKTRGVAGLTIEEKRALISGDGSPAVIASAEKKLARFQKSKTSKKHIEKVDKLIPVAEKYARENARRLPSGGIDRGDMDRIFHHHMGVLTRQAGLRC